ncbi:disintegrin and metalloproteinase domain-containing protein 9-like isoform X3 [Lathamus discolor]|uniref:disintegrin and metalloproteinase domain-containing protein 9-like isoform X3 n=1 Tax=Lathamus discolor TaxID=678569 RepID=UPI0032B86BEA
MAAGMEEADEARGGMRTMEHPHRAGSGMRPGLCGASGGAWVMALALLLCAEPGSRPAGAARIVYSEVTVPRRLEAKDGASPEGHRSYLITAEGNHHIVHLRQAKNLLVRDIPVFKYSEEGDLLTEFPYIQDDCYYEGIVEGFPGSIVSLSTCFGMSGVLQMGDLRYEIEPLKNSTTFQHLIFRRALEGGSRRLCQVPGEHQDHLPTDGELANGSRKIHTIEEAGGLKPVSVPARYLELALITNKELFKIKKKNETLMLHMFISISNILNTVYKRMKLRIVISAVEMWMGSDQVATSRSLARTLRSFSTWSQKEAAGRINYDNLQFLLGQNYKERGFAWKGTMCKPNSVGVVSFPGNDTVNEVMTLAHQIGHSLGFAHDDSKEFKSKHCGCNCTQRGCIMRSSPGTCLAFSNCSSEQYYNEVRRRNKPCLLNIPPLKPVLLEHCGNGILEKGEECDCGSDEECLHEGCCSPSNCMLVPRASCYRGECCHHCQFHPAGKICRGEANICDLPEYCNGSSAVCPLDAFKQDGTVCGDNDHCYEGSCHSHEAQCKALFGKAAQRAPLSCFLEVNVRGDRCGNCGWNGTHFTKCLEENVLCGRVQCVNIKRVPVREDGETVVQTAIDNVLCWGLDFHLDPDTPDEGAVKDGTSCGRNKICMNRTCVGAAFLNNDCGDTKCYGRGVCNNNDNCHCDFGWAPPDCQLEGAGGSIDSGPPPPLHPFTSARNIVKMARLMLFFILAFLLHKRAAFVRCLRRYRRWLLRRNDKGWNKSRSSSLKDDDLAEDEF